MGLLTYNPRHKKMTLSTHAGIMYQRGKTPYSLLAVDFNSDMTALPSSLTDVSATFTRGSTRYRQEGNLLVSKGNNVFFTEQDPVTGKWGYTPEPAATNVILRSTETGDNIWIKSPNANFITVGNNYNPGYNYDPIGGRGSEMLVGLLTGTAYLQQTVINAIGSGVVTLSVYYRYTGISFGYVAWPHWRIGIANGIDTASQWFNAQTNTLGSTTTGTAEFISSRIDRLGSSDWYRLQLTCKPNTSTMYVQFHICDADNTLTHTAGTKNLSIWGWQLESGYVATSFIQTVGSTASRSADVLSVATSNITYANASTIALMADFRKKVVTGSNEHMLFLNNGTSTNQAGLTLKSDNTARITTNSTNIDGATALNTTERKFAASFANGSKLRSLGGSALLSDTSSVMPASISALNIGHSLGASQPAAYIFGCKYYTTTRTQAQLNSLTT